MLSATKRERLHLALAAALAGALLAQIVLAARAAADHRNEALAGKLVLLQRHNELMRENNAMRDALDLAAEKVKEQHAEAREPANRCGSWYSITPTAPPELRALDPDAMDQA